MKRVIAIVSAALVVLLGVVFMPRPPQVSTDTTGDSALIEQVRPMLVAGQHHLSIAVIDGNEVTTAGFGATDDTEYEIGSVTKTITASLFADSIRRGEVRADTRLGDLLDVTGALADVTLGQLATQSSGLPSLSSSPYALVESALANLRADDPYPFDLERLLSDASGTPLGEPVYRYSNLGFALLGQALAAAAGTDYSSLATKRIFIDIGMPGSSVPTTVGDLADDAPTGYSASGRASDAWTLDAYAPAGSVRSTLDDMVTYVQAQLDGTAPGVNATEPRADATGETRIGYAWHITDGVTWHNGMTGGFASWVGFDRDTGRAVVVLSDSAIPVDDIGFELVEVP